jgi:hypothetical protein
MKIFMETKLTIRLKKNVIDLAKQYATEHDTSLSRLIENYLSAITGEKKSPDDISPLVRSLTGVIGAAAPDHAEEKYHKHLEEKYS